ncbi:uncharacterized protein, partial [Haliotis cracherodii]|uniref:uncharacterized protein n=1 Tax=Haliotis cracherodii TaxID=6455 RepID=UPI0039E74873
TEVQRLVQSSLALNTWNLYESALKSFNVFRISFSLPHIWPTPVDHLMHFIAHLSLTGKSPRTAKSYISALTTWQKLHGMHDLTSHFLIQKALIGFVRQKQKADTRLPITVDLLSVIVTALPVVCASVYETSLFTAAYLLAFFGFFRISELVAGSAKDFSHKACLLSDIHVAADISHITICLRSSKTDQGGRGVQIQITAILHSRLCPVRAMQQFLSIRPPVHGHVFVHFDGRPLNRFQFQSMLRKALSFSLPHLNLHLFSSHSFRIGAATTAAINGVSSKQIQKYGRWKSNCYSKYIRITQLTT